MPLAEAVLIGVTGFAHPVTIDPSRSFFGNSGRCCGIVREASWKCMERPQSRGKPLITYGFQT
jgi:hypothetical protein